MVYPEPPATPATVSYDYDDIADGTGVDVFYLAETETTGGAAKVLTPVALFSSGDGIEEFNAAGSPTNDDYDLTAFNQPRTLIGTALLSIPVWSGNSGSVSAQLFRYDGSTETAVTSAIIQNVTASAAAKMMLIPMPMTETLFSDGDILRLTIITTSSGGGDWKMGIDPAGRSHIELTITTTAKILIPKRLDI